MVSRQFPAFGRSSLLIALYEVILTLELKDEEEGYEIGYAHLKKQGYDIEAVSSYEKYSFDVDVLKAAM